MDEVLATLKALRKANPDALVYVGRRTTGGPDRLVIEVVPALAKKVAASLTSALPNKPAKVIDLVAKEKVAASTTPRKAVAKKVVAAKK